MYIYIYICCIFCSLLWGLPIATKTITSINFLASLQIVLLYYYSQHAVLVSFLPICEALSHYLTPNVVQHLSCCVVPILQLHSPQMSVS
jgi:hypothetical protein